MAIVAGFPRTFVNEICEQLGLDAKNVADLHLHFNNDGSQIIEVKMYHTGDTHTGIIEVIKKYKITAVELNE
jgi:hypothetical protein